MNDPIFHRQAGARHYKLPIPTTVAGCVEEASIRPWFRGNVVGAFKPGLDSTTSLPSLLLPIADSRRSISLCKYYDLSSFCVSGLRRKPPPNLYRFFPARNIRRLASRKRYIRQCFARASAYSLRLPLIRICMIAGLGLGLSSPTLSMIVNPENKFYLGSGGP